MTLSSSSLPRPMLRVDKAVSLLDKARIAFPSIQTSEQPITQVMQQLTPLAPNEVMAILNTLSKNEGFNEVVRAQMTGKDISDRHLAIAKIFDSVRQDMMRMIGQAEQGQTGLSTHLSNLWMKLSRGSIVGRFDKVRTELNQLIVSAQGEVEREDTVLQAYAEFRIGLKEASMLTTTVLEKARLAHEAAQAQLTERNAAVQAAPDDASRAPLEVQRDEALQAFRVAEAQLRAAQSLSTNLVVAYNATDVIMARFAQVNQTKSEVVRESATFSQTHNNVMTGLAATLEATRGLSELGRGLEATKQGTEAALRDLASVSGQVQTQALEAAYRPGISVDTMRQLVDAIVTFQSTSHELVTRLQQESADNAKAIEAVVEDGRQRMIAVAQGKSLPPSTAS